MELYSFYGYCKNPINEPNILSLYGNLQSSYIEIDRFGFLNQFSNYKLGKSDNFTDFISDMPNSDEKFTEIFNKRILEIIERSNKENLKIYVSWSGGVDSSAIVCGLLMSEIEKSKINILYSSKSIEEYPLLYEKLNENKINMIDMSNDIGAVIFSNSINDGLLITGWCADQLFGSIINQIYPDYYNKPFEHWIIDYSKTENFDWNDSIEQCKTAFEHYKLPVKTFSEWTWFMNFFIKWNYVKMSSYATIGKYTDRVINFYDTIDFQKWAINNFDKLSALSQLKSNEYKLPLKKIILNYTKDKEYYNNKGKYGSWSNISAVQNKIKLAFLDNEGYKFYIEQGNGFRRRYFLFKT